MAWRGRGVRRSNTIPERPHSNVADSAPRWTRHCPVYSAKAARLPFEMTRPSTTVSESCRRVMQFPGEICGTVAGDRDGEKCLRICHSRYPKGSTELDKTRGSRTRHPHAGFRLL